jgi:hypothetical protein
MKNLRSRVALCVAVLGVVMAIPTDAQSPKKAAGAVTLPAVGTFAAGAGQFTGNITINKFEQRGSEIVAIGVVTGVLSRGGLTLGSAVVGPVALPVQVAVGGRVLASVPARQTGTLTRATWSADTPSLIRNIAVQENCQVVDIALGPFNIDVLGVQVTLAPIAFNLTGIAGTPLGDLVCAVSDLIQNVAGLVNVLNAILGLLTGLLGGLTGGLG